MGGPQKMGGDDEAVAKLVVAALFSWTVYKLFRRWGRRRKPAPPADVGAHIVSSTSAAGVTTVNITLPPAASVINLRHDIK
ncbi:hypothetical protein DM860_004351 [Cuscuta australis]|uniref:Uncharacterized protein n=1 Tax=Cuscuta australis TaxID=267555 RepID=A0A328E8I1_9ASTE|nr:hypothetical protein DM860_004351 [Cuscuta australis]